MSKILIIDDDSWFAESQSRQLTNAGHYTRHVSHAPAAIDEIDAWQPDVLVLDMLLAGHTGLTLLHELQSHSDLAGLPVILSSNLAAQLELEQLRPYGVRRILDKTTMQPGDVLAAVRSVLP